MKIILLILVSFLISGELEVEGNLTVTEGVNASSFAGDGSGLTNLPSLGDMKPDRIYTYYKSNGSTFNFIVPNNKVWKIIAIGQNYSSTTSFKVNGNSYYLPELQDGQTMTEVWAMQNATVSSSEAAHTYSMTIFEYSISGSGTDQGMDYVEP